MLQRIKCIIFNHHWTAFYSYVSEIDDNGFVPVLSRWCKKCRKKETIYPEGKQSDYTLDTAWNKGERYAKYINENEIF